MKKKIVSLLVCLLLLTGCDGGSASYKTITENEATELISNNAVIIDVRSNSGGYLSSVTDIINMFLEKGYDFLKNNKDFVLSSERQYFPFDPYGSSLYFALLKKEGGNDD